jgi:ABC-type cobalamin/Fe3+-siderophores transport system ATPase subunit
MRSAQSTINHRIVVSRDTGTLTACTTVALATSDLAQDRPPKRSKVRTRLARPKHASSRAADRRAKKSQTTLWQGGRARKNYHSANSQWPNWPDPLDFQEVPVEEAIARINAAGYFITRNGVIYKIDPDGGVTAQRPGGFNNFFACRQARCDDGKLISASAAWRRSLKRREHEQIGYWPEDHGCPDNSYNLWQGWGVTPKLGVWSIIYDHILGVIADGDKNNASYIIDWCAHMVQRPWEKPGVALVLIGQQGTGKTLLTHIVARVIGRQNTLITANGKKLFAQFNWHLADKMLIGAEEAFFAENRELSDQLKHLLTGDEIEVEQKFGQRMSIKSLHRMIMTSNHANVIEMSDDERRFFVCDVSDKRRGDETYFAPLWRVAKGEDNATLAAFMHELKTRDIANWRPEPAARDVSALHSGRQKLVSLLRRRASGEIQRSPSLSR